MREVLLAECLCPPRIRMLKPNPNVGRTEPLYLEIDPL